MFPYFAGLDWVRFFIAIAILKKIAAAAVGLCCIRLPCTRTTAPHDTGSAFRQNPNRFRSRNRPTRPRIPTCPCANPTQMNPSRSDAYDSLQ